MTTKFCKIEDVELNFSNKADVSLISSNGGIEKGKVITISFRPCDSLTTTQLTLTRRQARELSKQLTKWINGDPLTQVE